MDNEFRVWVGCLACYNAGTLVGEWFDADDCPQDEDEFNARVPEHAKVRDSRDPNPHEELWCFDHENSPVDAEFSPMTAAEYAELWAGVGDAERGVFAEWLDGESREFDSDAVEAFNDSCAGHWSTPEDYLEDVFPEDDLPDWAKGEYWEILKAKWRDIEMGGEMRSIYRDGGYWLFRNY